MIGEFARASSHAFGAVRLTQATSALLNSVLGKVYAISGSRNAMPKDKKKPCKNCEGKGLIKVGDKKVKCQRCGGTGVQS
jgi:DnaJ-class molecular chaperone